jgi:hypothetical protein
MYLQSYNPGRPYGMLRRVNQYTSQKLTGQSSREGGLSSPQSHSSTCLMILSLIGTSYVVSCMYSSLGAVMIGVCVLASPAETRAAALRRNAETSTIIDFRQPSVVANLPRELLFEVLIYEGCMSWSGKCTVLRRSLHGVFVLREIAKM